MKKIKFEEKEHIEVKGEPVPNMFGGMSEVTKVVGTKWVEGEREYSEGMYTLAKRLERKGALRNVRVEEGQ